MEKGLSSQVAAAHLKTFGQNIILAKKKATPFAIFLSQFPTFINGILATAGILSFIIHDIVDSVFIFTILLLNALFGFIQEYKAEKSLEKLQTMIRPFSRVLRDGKEREISTDELVPGDIVVLSEGDRIPADGIVTQEIPLELDESILTGESLPVAKKKNDTLYKGTLLVRGKTRLQVTQTGMQTKFGKIAQTLDDITIDKTPLQIRLDTLGKILSLVAIAFALLVIPLGIARDQALFPLILLAISIGVAAIPEGLPAVITIALAIGTNRMAKKQAIVRKMPSVETLGAIQILLVDKTGTLTQNSMRVKKYWATNPKALEDLLKGCLLGNTASLVQKADGDKPDWDIVGDKTDGALLLFVKSLEKDASLVANEKVIDEYVFDSTTKTITTVVENSKTYVFVRGAPEVIAQRSKLTPEELQHMTTLFETYAKEGLRVIGFGKKTEAHPKRERNHLEENLNFLGFVGIYDPPRPETKQAIIDAKEAGIRTIMVTGDNELTALTIAKDIGLIEHDEDVLTGSELQKLTDDQVKNILPKTRVFARTTPEDKLRLVRLFKQQGFVVGVTGDGVNDALALKQADVGIAMGETGTDVAKEAADIILTNDNFTTIVHAIEEGRQIYNNIVKAVTYLLSSNLSELSLIVAGAVLGVPSPLLPTQILWINIVTDGLPALALASDTENNSLLKQNPRDPKSPILTKERITFILTVGLSLTAILLVIFLFLLQSHGVNTARTVTFNLLVVCHMLIAFLVRGGSILHPNKFLILAALGTITLQTIISFVPFFQKIFSLGL